MCLGDGSSGTGHAIHNGDEEDVEPSSTGVIPTCFENSPNGFVDTPSGLIPGEQLLFLSSMVEINETKCKEMLFGVGFTKTHSSQIHQELEITETR